MQQIIYVVVTMLVMQVAATRAEKVRFECDASLFESVANSESEVSPFDYDTPLYEGLWPMTIEAFRRGDWEHDREVFSFCIAIR